MQYNQPYGMPPEQTWGDTPYINGNPATGTQGSIPPAASIEYPQREIVNVIQDTGRAPSNSDLHQLGRSIQTGLLNYAQDTGTANAYACNLSPAPTAYTAGLYVCLKVSNTNTGASVFNINSLGNKPIVRADGSPAQAGDLAVGVITCLMFDGTNFQMVWSMKVANAAGTQYLTSARDFYVNASTGNDSYDGQTATYTTGIHGPWKTLQQASNVINQFNLNGFNVNVHVADGSYAYFTLPSPSGTGNVVWTGNAANPANVLVYTDSHTACAGSQIGNQTMNGFKLKSSGASSTDPLCCLYISGNMSTLTILNMEFGGSPGAMVSSGRSASINFSSGPFTVSGSSPGNPYWLGAFCYAFANGQIQAPTGASLAQITINQAISVQYGWIVSSINAMAQQYVSSFPGASYVSGPKYYASLNGVINSSGSGANFYPGSTAGSVASGGQYA